MVGKDVLSNAFPFRSETDFCFVVCFLVLFFLIHFCTEFFFFLSVILNGLLEIMSFIIAFTAWNETKQAFNLPRNTVYLECLWKCLKD